MLNSAQEAAVKTGRATIRSLVSAMRKSIHIKYYLKILYND
jgi:hypothetical protein